MGDRGNIRVRQSDGSHVYLYTHWGGTEIKRDLAIALHRGRDRWDDETYLARIIFCAMLRNYGKDTLDHTTGLGISTYETDNEHPILTVDCKNKTVRIGEAELQSFAFEDFVSEYAPKAKGGT